MTADIQAGQDGHEANDLAGSPPTAAGTAGEAPGPIRRAISVPGLIELLRKRKELLGLTPTDAGVSPGFRPLVMGLVAAYEETARDEATWEFEGTNPDGFVRAVTLTFAPGRGGDWRLHSVSVRIHSDDPPGTFKEVRRRATAVLRKPKWMDLGPLGRTAWSLGDHWELTAAIIEGGEIQLRSGLPPRN